MRVRRALAGPVVASLLPCLMPAPAVSAETTRGGHSAVLPGHTVLQDVVVTAQRREERLQAVPVSASALSADQLKQRQIDDLHSLQYAVPNLAMVPNRSSGSTTSIAMRGQVELETTPTVDPAVGLYLGGVYLARTTGANLELIDMERVEVLRGPQGTLFGRNTTGGAISLIPRPPGFAREGLLEADVGNYDYRALTAIVNAPLVDDRLAGRFVASHAEHSGYGRNTLLGVNLEGEVSSYARVQLRFAPSDRWELLLSLDGSRIDNGAQLMTLLHVEPGADALPVMLGNPADRLSNYVDAVARRIEADRAGSASTRVWGTSAVLTADFAAFTLKSITGYRALELDAFDVDQDGTPYDLGVILFRGDEQDQVSQELQLYGDALGDRLSWIGGLHYFRETATYRQHFRFYRPPLRGWEVRMPAGGVRNDSVAAYAQLAYALMPKLRLTAGARYNLDGRQLTSRNRHRTNDGGHCSLVPALLDEPEGCQATLPEREFSYTPWTLVLDYTPTEATMIYAKLSRGHRAGGYNIRGTTAVDLDTFEPEQVTAYEIGAKAFLFDDRLRVNLALFQSQFDDIQLTQHEVTLPGLPGVRYIENGGRARIEGGELEVTAMLGRLSLGGHYGFTRPKFIELDPLVEGVTLESVFPLTPAWTASLVADLGMENGSWGFEAHADYAWRDDVLYSYDPESLARQGSYGLLNARFSARPLAGRVELSVWGRNLTDRRYIDRAFESEYYISAVPGDPRTYGVTLAYRLGD